MARRTKVIVIKDPRSRDDGKQFMVTEMDAESAEWWAIRVLQGLLGSNQDVDADIFSAPLSKIAGLAFIGLAKMPAEQLKPLMDEMKPCIKVLLPDGKTSRDVLASDIEDISTWLELRKEVFGVLTGFFGSGDE
jgi:hypothetical protein